MPISNKMEQYLKEASWIRKLFDEANQMRQASSEPVYDLTIGNPELEPPPAFKKALQDLAASPSLGLHKYMSNVGYEETREAIAKSLNAEHPLGFTAGNIVMTVGAAGAINIALKALLDPGDEIIATIPYFVEYKFYAENHGGNLVLVPTLPNFDLDVDAIDAAITPRTKVVLINNPNNPTGMVYPQSTLDALGERLRKRSQERGEPIYLLDDAPYRKLVFDMEHCTSAFPAYENTLFATSHSKDLGIPGERIGFLAISPRCADGQRIFAAAAFANRSLGFVNAPALMQRIVATIQSETVDLSWYKTKRDWICRELIAMGYEVPVPAGAFYIFPKAPGGDSVAFMNKMKDMRVLIVPGSGFGMPSYFRLAYCVNDNVIAGALPIFAKAIQG